MNNLSKLKFCFLAGTLEHGGAERQLFYILQALRQAGASVRLLTLESGGFWEGKISALGIQAVPVGEHRSRLKRLLRIVHEVRKNPPDILQSQHFYANAYVGLTAKFLRVRGIGAMRSNGRMEVSESGRVGGWLNLHCPAIIAANSQNAMRYAGARGFPASRLFFLPNAVDTERFQPADSLPREPLTLIAAGRLVSEKRFDRFITIIYRLRTVHRLNVRGLIVGAGCQDEDLRLPLEGQSRRLGLFPDAIRFCGGVADIRPLFHEAAVCVLNSDYEGSPNVLLEAMACGLPVVASNVGGVPEIVRHGRTGFLLEPDDLDGFVTTLAELLINPGLRAEMGQRARNFVEENHSLHRLPEFLENLYQPAFSILRPAAINSFPNVSIQPESQPAHRA